MTCLANNKELPLVFACDGSALYGILHRPVSLEDCGVLVVVGGPQTRVGSHRQFVLLGRRLAASGIPVLRFDYSGMGDCEGDMCTFEDVGADIRCAVDQFFIQIPALKKVVIWGLCDAASSACFYAQSDDRISGLVLLNPWVRTEESNAKAYLKHYYLQRLLSPDLWWKIRRGEFQLGTSLASLFEKLVRVVGIKRSGSVAPTETPFSAASGKNLGTLPDRMFDGLQRFSGRVLIICSGNDLTAAEFLGMVAASRKWRKLLGDTRFTQYQLQDADHTFSRSLWRDQVADWTLEWVKS